MRGNIFCTKSTKRVVSVAIQRSCFQGGKEMSKKETSLSSIELEAVAHFHLVAKALGIEGGRFGPLKVAKYDYLDGKTVRLITEFEGAEIEGLFFFQKPEDAWTFCGWTNNQVNAEELGWRAEFRYRQGKNGSEYEISKRYLVGETEEINVKIQTT